MCVQTTDIVSTQEMLPLVSPKIFKVSIVACLLSGQDQLPIATSKVYSAVADLWKPWLDEDAISTLRKG